MLTLTYSKPNHNPKPNPNRTHYHRRRWSNILNRNILGVFQSAIIDRTDGCPSWSRPAVSNYQHIEHYKAVLQLAESVQPDQQLTGMFSTAEAVRAPVVELYWWSTTITRCSDRVASSSKIRRLVDVRFFASQRRRGE